MATTTLALGTVPQKIVDVGPALTTSYVAQATFDTHGAESLGIQFRNVKGGETSTEVLFEAQIRDTGAWVALPVSKSVTVVTNAANATLATQFYLGFNVTQFRIRAKTSGSANATTRVEIWGLLSAPTFPLIGTAF